MSDIESILSGKEPIYIFGYGSLTWKPDFEYDSKQVGYIKNYERRFWQGSTYHRGSVEHPGRCVTIVKVEGSVCYGMIYEVRQPAKIVAALDYLNVREQKQGGYDVYVVPVYSKNQSPDSEPNMYSVLYIATDTCKGYIGDGPIEKTVEDIATARGKVGHSIEYLFRITDFMKEQIPDVYEEHLYTLDKMVRERIGVSPDPYQFWEELMKDADFYALAHPTPNYRELWKHAIAENIKHNLSIERWVLVIMKISKMKNLKLSGLERVDIGADHLEKYAIRDSENNNNNNTANNTTNATPNTITVKN